MSDASQDTAPEEAAPDEGATLASATAASATAATSARRRWLSVLAKAPRDELEALTPECLHSLTWRSLRAPEVGMVMLRGRTGGDGAPFNFGETTVTRCSVELDSGGATLVGHGYVLGRDKRHAQLVALLDALLQDPAQRSRLEARLVAPLEAMQTARRRRQARKAAATKVEFFTMVRGDD